MIFKNHETLKLPNRVNIFEGPCISIFAFRIDNLSQKSWSEMDMIDRQTENQYDMHEYSVYVQKENQNNFD